MPDLRRLTLEELTIKAILAIGSQDKCLLINFCQRNDLDCEGHKEPWCSLEYNLSVDDINEDTIQELESEKIIQILLAFQDKLSNKAVGPALFKTAHEDFACPFFRTEPNPCPLYVCLYHSIKVESTSCILSSSKEGTHKIPVSELSVAKDISKHRFLKLLFGLAAGKHWEKTEAILQEYEQEIPTCEKCGHFASVCEEDPDRCSKRQKFLPTLIKDSFVPDHILVRYPIVLILLVMTGTFKEWISHIFPKKIFRLYEVKC
jgi:hypothetical protein